MHELQDPRILARASLDAPPGMQSLGEKRVNVVLRPTDDGRFRWFREDGTPTVVGAATVEGANRTAQLVWRNYAIEIQEPRPQT